MALYDQLSAAGLEVFVVKAAHCKALPGRKTDVCDTQWLQHLHTAGLLKASYVPEDSFRPIRYLMRHREALIGDAARKLQPIQKALIEMNVHLHHAVSDIDGVSGRAILEAILADCPGHPSQETEAVPEPSPCATPRPGRSYELQPGGGGAPASRPPVRKHPLQVDFASEALRIYGVHLSEIPGVPSGVLGCLIAEIVGQGHLWEHFRSAGQGRRDHGHGPQAGAHHPHDDRPGVPLQSRHVIW